MESEISKVCSFLKTALPQPIFEEVWPHYYKGKKIYNLHPFLKTVLPPPIFEEIFLHYRYEVKVRINKLGKFSMKIPLQFFYQGCRYQFRIQFLMNDRVDDRRWKHRRCFGPDCILYIHDRDSHLAVITFFKPVDNEIFHMEVSLKASFPEEVISEDIVVSSLPLDLSILDFTSFEGQKDSTENGFTLNFKGFDFTFLHTKYRTVTKEEAFQTFIDSETYRILKGNFF